MDRSKHITILIILIAFSISCKKAPNVRIERTYGPKLLEIKQDGNRTSEIYHPTDSVIEFEKIYINGKLDSVTEWGNDGVLWFQTKYKNGLRHGKHIGYNHNGNGEIWYIHYYEFDQLVRKEEYN